jgi:hypothetical protein
MQHQKNLNVFEKVWLSISNIFTFKFVSLPHPLTIICFYIKTLQVKQQKPYYLRKSLAVNSQHSHIPISFYTNPFLLSNTLRQWLKSSAIAQQVSRQLPTAATRVQSQVISCRLSRLSGAGVGFLWVLYFSLLILIPPAAPHSSLSSGAGTIGQTVADIPSGLSLTPPQET